MIQMDGGAQNRGHKRKNKKSDKSEYLSTGNVGEWRAANHPSDQKNAERYENDECVVFHVFALFAPKNISLSDSVTGFLLDESSV